MLHQDVVFYMIVKKCRFTLGSPVSARPLPARWPTGRHACSSLCCCWQGLVRKPSRLKPSSLALLLQKYQKTSTMTCRPAVLPAAVALALACVALAPLPHASAHGFVAQPAARNVMRNWQYCPHCVNSGGPWVVSKEGKLTWPAYSAPVSVQRRGGARPTWWRVLAALINGRGGVVVCNSALADVSPSVRVSFLLPAAVPCSIRCSAYLPPSPQPPLTTHTSAPPLTRLAAP